MLQSISEWKNSIGSSSTNSFGLTPVSEWAKNHPSVPKVSTLNKVWTGVKNYANESANTVIGLGNLFTHPVKTIQEGIKTAFLDPYLATINKAGEGLATLTNNYGKVKTTKAEKVAGGAEVVTGTVGAFLNPITGLFALAERAPGTKQVADVINLPFIVTGKIGEFTAEKAVDMLPDTFISPQAKDIIRQPIKELGSLAGQIILGGKILKKLETYSIEGKKVTPEIATQVVKEATLEVKNTIEPPQVSQPTQQMSVTEWKANDKPVFTPQATEVGIVKPSKLGVDLETRALAEKIQTDFGQLPEYKTMNMVDQATRAMDLVKSDPAKAQRILDLKEAPPADLRLGSIYGAMEDRAIKGGDVNSIIDLAKSKIPTIASTLGQEVKAFDVLRESDSPVQALRDVIQSRVKSAEKSGVTVEKIKTEAKAQHQTPGIDIKTWSEFLDNITC